MNQLFDKYNKAFDSKLRVGIMSTLLDGEWVDFTTLKKRLKATDGNLSSHLSALEKLNMIRVKKQFVNNRPKSTYRVSRNGLRLFKQHLEVFSEIQANNAL